MQGVFIGPENLAEPSSSSQRELQAVWLEAKSKFDKLKNDEPKLKVWETLDKVSGPQMLVTVMRGSPYAKETDHHRAISLAETSIGAVMRFDKEISAVMGGLSHVSFGATNIIWAGLSAVFHIAEDLLKTPAAIIEIIAKISAILPRIEVYHDLFSDSPKSMDISSLTVKIYQSVAKFNIDWIKWSSSLSGKAVILREDPRKRFQKIFEEIDALSEEIRKQSQAIQWQEQRGHQEDVMCRFVQQEKRIEELSALIRERPGVEMKKRDEAIAAEKSKYKEYISRSGLRQEFWQMLHEDGSWKRMQEDTRPLVFDDNFVAEREPWRNWKSGLYLRRYGAPDEREPLASIYLAIDWKAEDDALHPSLRWTIETPNSLFYPGKHKGDIKLIEPLRDFDGELGSFRAAFSFTSRIFSTLPSEYGTLSSSGLVEEAPAVLIIASALEYFADVLAKGPYEGDKGFWDYMGDGRVSRYLRHCDQDPDKFMCASAFFANAFTRNLAGLNAFESTELPEQCRGSSKLAIKELIEGYGLAAEFQEQARTDQLWDIDRTYAQVHSQLRWVECDQMWASRIAQSAGLQLCALR